jgi:hypothetical protein
MPGAIHAEALQPDSGMAQVAGVDMLREPAAARKLIGVSG